MPTLHLALIHYPVLNKSGEIVPSAVTNLDLHDIARAAKTFGVRTFYIVTPLAEQQALVEEILAHWLTGAGGCYNPLRRAALERVRLADDLAQVCAQVEAANGVKPQTVMTSARELPGALQHAAFRKLLWQGGQYILCLGTGWGISPELFATADIILGPICGADEYNHLSVRCAAAIMLDRLLGRNG